MNSDNYFCFAQGYFYDEALLRSELISKTFLEKYIKDESSLKKWDGHYSGFIFNKSNKQLVLFSDYLGFEKVYYRSSHNGFIACNNLYSVISNRCIHREIDKTSLSEMLLYQYPVENRTIERKNKTILPNEIVVYDNLHKVVIKEYNTLIIGNRSRNVGIKELFRAYEQHYETLKKYIDSPIALYLSQGKDSRILLAFLRKMKTNYERYHFHYGNMDLMETVNVEKIAKKIKKELNTVNSYESDEILDIMLAMDSTYHNEWNSVADLANKNGYTYFNLGTGGEAITGKCIAFRDIFKHRILFEKLFSSVLKENNDSFDKSFPMLPSFSKIKIQHLEKLKKFTQKAICDTELSWFINYRNFRNAIPILHRARFYGTPIHSQNSIKVLQTYLKLPEKLIRSQEAHTAVACLDKELNSIPSIHGNIPLSLEKHLRGSILKVHQIQSKFNLKFGKKYFLGKHLKKNYFKHGNLYNPYCYEFSSSKFKDITGSISVDIFNKRLKTKVRDVDMFLYVAFEHMENFDDNKRFETIKGD